MNMTNNTDVNPVRPSDILPLAQFVQTTNRFLFVLGAGGGGKTSILVNEVGPALGREVWYANLNGLGPTEVTGYGKIMPDSLDMLFSEPSVWPTKRRVADKPVLLVIDEFPDYDPYVQALARSLFPASGAPMIGPHELGSDVLVAVLGNRRGDGVRNARTEDAPMTERCYKVTLTSELGDWLDWVDTRPELAATESHVPAFLKFGNTTGDEANHFHPLVEVPYDGKPHPCPRTWESAMLAEPMRKGNKRLHNILVRGCVGDRAASAYMGFLGVVDSLPDLDKFKADPKGYAIPTDPSAQYAMVSACLAVARQGVVDLPIAVHSGGFDWLVHLLMSVRGDLRSYGARSAVRRGIPLDEHPQSTNLLFD